MLEIPITLNLFFLIIGILSTAHGIYLGFSTLRTKIFDGHWPQDPKVVNLNNQIELLTTKLDLLKNELLELEQRNKQLQKENDEISDAVLGKLRASENL